LKKEGELQVEVVEPEESTVKIKSTKEIRRELLYVTYSDKEIGSSDSKDDKSDAESNEKRKQDKSIDQMLNKYMRYFKKSTEKDPLKFWKAFEFKFSS
jgi:hypothetical protein